MIEIRMADIEKIETVDNKFWLFMKDGTTIAMYPESGAVTKWDGDRLIWARTLNVIYLLTGADIG